MREETDVGRFSPDDRLVGWRAIAAYLGCSPRTARRYEKDKGLPVQRLGRVYSYATRIDEWLAANPLQPDANDKRVQRVHRRVLVQALAVSLALVLVVAVLGDPDEGASRTDLSVRVEDGRIIAQTVDGSPRLTLAPRQGFHFVGTDLQSVALAAADGITHVTAVLEAGPGDSWRAVLVGGIGDGHWKLDPGPPNTFPDAHVSPAYWTFNAASIWPLGQAGSAASQLVWLVRDRDWWPSAALFVNSGGELIGRFVNSGWLLTAAAVETRLGPRALLGGISNSKAAAVLAVLDLNSPTGHSPEDAMSSYRCIDCPDGRPLQYVVFPQRDVGRVEGLPYNRTSSIAVHSNMIRVIVSEGVAADPVALSGLASSPVQWHYLFSYEDGLDLVSALPSDHYRSRHDVLFRSGALDHPSADCPELSAPHISMWTSVEGWREIRP